jgi:hypothetical protein
MPETFGCPLAVDVTDFKVGDWEPSGETQHLRV